MRRRPPKRRLMTVHLPNSFSGGFCVDTFGDSVREAHAKMPETKRNSPDSAHSDVHMSVCVGDRMYIPRDREFLKIRVLITAHCGKAGYRGTDTPRSHTQSYFMWTACKTTYQYLSHYACTVQYYLVEIECPERMPTL